MDTGSYTSAHRAFLQALFSRSTITFPEAKTLLSHIQSAYCSFSQGVASTLC
jgi:Nse1 non-SMC component of SMC5-6 complex